jgi:hypothetical protein
MNLISRIAKMSGLTGGKLAIAARASSLGGTRARRCASVAGSGLLLLSLVGEAALAAPAPPLACALLLLPLPPAVYACRMYSHTVGHSGMLLMAIKPHLCQHCLYIQFDRQPACSWRIAAPHACLLLLLLRLRLLGRAAGRNLRRAALDLRRQLAGDVQQLHVGARPAQQRDRQRRGARHADGDDRLQGNLCCFEDTDAGCHLPASQAGAGMQCGTCAKQHPNDR